MEISAEKSLLLVTGESTKRNGDDQDTTITINRTELEQVTHFEYLEAETDEDV